MANLINESEIRATWTPIIESATGINDANKLAWMSQYCHNHKLYEDANIMSLDPTMNLAGMGATKLPIVGGAEGSGDKAPSLLPLAMQVAAQTVGLDLVPVVPMAGPMGLLSYLDFVYEGGRLQGSPVMPTYVKTNLVVKAAATGVSAVIVNGVAAESRIDGKAIYQIANDATVDGTVAPANAAELFVSQANETVELVKALEDHVIGASGNADGTPYSREMGERTADKLMGLSLFSKAVEAKTYQIAAAVTREQVQDLKQFGVDAVAQVESVLTNELTQSINQYILGEIRDLGEDNVTAAFGAAAAFDITLAAASALAGGETVASEHRKILTQVLAAANLIANRGRRGAGTFAVVGPQVATVLQSVSGFVANPMANTFSQAAGAIYPLGSVAGVNVYTDPTMAWGDYSVAVGRKGDGNGPGLVFMPYLMAESVQTIAEGTMAPKVAVKSRFALVAAGFHPETQYVKFNIASGAAWTNLITLS
jgi:hypothetical protein